MSGSVEMGRRCEVIIGGVTGGRGWAGVKEEGLDTLGVWPGVVLY